MPPSPSVTGRGASPKAPSRGPTGGGRAVPIALAATVLLAAGAAGGWWFFFRPAPARADVLLHTVRREPLVVTVAEKGTLESADNRDLVCKVRAGSKGFASTINWVIDDGSRVQPGQLLMLLDSSALKDQEDAKQIDLVTALANLDKAKNAVTSARTQNKQNVATAESVLTKASNTLKDYTGLNYDATRAALAAIGGGPASLSEAGTFRQSVDDLSGKLKLAESEAEQNREREAWAGRMVKLSYMSAAQAQAEKSRLDSSLENARSLRAKLNQLLTSDRDQTLTNLILDREIALLGVERAYQDARANLSTFEAEERKCNLLLGQVEDALHEISLQRDECKITAPDTIEPDSMVVYFKNESNRFSGTNAGMIEQGAQVKEGQKMLRIPNLHRMQVNTKVHEAMVARIRGDVRVPTRLVDSAMLAMLANPNPFTRLVSQKQEYIDKLRQQFRRQEYQTVSEGQKAMIRVDALPERVFEGHVRTVAAVASQADSWISDVKLYQTLVMVDYEVLPDGTKKRIDNEQLKPDMTAEVTITVDTAREPVLTIPVQSIIGGAEMGGKREVFVKTPTGYDRREVKLGLYNEKAVEIREGLAENEEIVLNPKVLLAADDKTKTRDDGGKNGNKGGNGKGEGDYPKGEGGSPAIGGPKGDGKTGTGAGGGGKGKKGGGGGPPVQ